MAEANKKGGIISVRSKDVFVAPPGPLGYSHLIEPDEYQPPNGPLVRSFKMNTHYSEEAQAAFTARIQKFVVDALWPDFLKEAAKSGRPQWITKVKGKEVKQEWPVPEPSDYVDAALRPFAEGARIELPYVTFSNRAEYTDKYGVTKLKTMRATDAAGNSLDLKTLRMGIGSVVQPLLVGGIYSSPSMDQGLPKISLKLQGLRVIKLEQYGGGGPSLGEISEEDMALLGGEVEADDLSGYVKEVQQEAARGATAHHIDDGVALDDEEIPF